MAAGETKSSEAFPMKGGDGAGSYAKNSSYQRGVQDAAKEYLKKAIAEKLDIEILSSSNTFHVADLGCSVGPNTFYAVKNILESVQSKYQTKGGATSQIPEFQVFFNDHTTNDFNMLFKSLPHNKQYYAAGVPGSFYGRIFPNASIHFVHSSYTNHWLSRVPKEIVDKNCPAWNKGRIHYLDSTDEVVRAYEDQYAKDMECFLHARAQEIVNGGLMVLTISGRPDGTPHSVGSSNVTYQLLGSCLMEMVRKGVVSEDKVDAFNIPVYSMSPQELQTAVELNGCFSIEGMEVLPHVSILDSVPKSAPLIGLLLRAATEGVFKQHFGDEILDELFDLYCKKLVAQPCIFESTETINFFAVLKRKAN